MTFEGDRRVMCNKNISLENFCQNILGKIKKSNQIEQEQKILISVFP